MDNIPNASPVFWMITTAITTVSSIVLGIITWLKSAKLMPKELTRADLENKQAELSIVEQYDSLATSATARRIEVQDKFDELEMQYKELQKANREILRRFDEQKLEFEKQKEMVESLVKELTLAQAYNHALIQQMCQENITPVDISTVSVEEFKENVKKRNGIKK